MLGQESPLEEETVTGSSILAWRIPRTESGGLQSMGWQRVGCDRARMHRIYNCRGRELILNNEASRQNKEIKLQRGKANFF